MNILFNFDIPGIFSHVKGNILAPAKICQVLKCKNEIHL